MKNLILSVFSFGSLVAVSCNSAPDAYKAEASDAVVVNDKPADTNGLNFNVDVVNSKVEWIGSKPVGDKHVGTINIKSGSFAMNAAGAILNGAFVLDMNSIAVSDIKEADKNAKLVGHLKGADFFETNTYPEAKFEITGVAVASDADKLKFKEATHLISGNLTMKGITKNLSIPAKVTATENEVQAVSEFNFDRTKWNVMYESNELKDQFINKDVNIKMNLKAVKA